LSRATTLLDLYLFLTPENYITTRSAYTAFLPFYANYTIPPAHYKAAEARSSHLSAAAILASFNDESEAPTTALGTGMGKLGFGNARVRGIAAKAGRRMGLEGAVSGLFGPLAELLGDKKYFFDDERPSSLDALVLGYVGMMLRAELPDRWAKEILETKYPTLLKWIVREAPGVFDTFKATEKDSK
jgi:sorting and assembly machinery component 37